MNGTYLKNTKILSISLAAALFMTGCNAGDITPSCSSRRPDLLIFFERKDIGALPSEGLLFYGTSFLTRGIFLRRNTMMALTA